MAENQMMRHEMQGPANGDSLPNKLHIIDLNSSQHRSKTRIAPGDLYLRYAELIHPRLVYHAPASTGIHT